ncbi:MAG: leucine--tRNA ligase [bacterium]
MSQTPDQPVAGTLPSDGPEHRYTAVLAERIEGRWQRWWAERGTFVQPNPGEVGFDASRPKFYCLDMFPYPSGAGLHVGHPEGYTATDILCRYKRAKGFNVLHPMGWDAFGLPAEQYAIQTGVHPAVTTKGAIENFRRQLQRFGFCYDWSREVGTIDPGYYRWTQWVFIQLYEAWFDHEQQRARPIAELVEEFASGKRVVEYNPRGEAGESGAGLGEWAGLDKPTQRKVLGSYRLAYQSTTTVNWCPKLGTVLANDEVIDGRSERGGHPVLRKPMRQWMLRITDYADRLLGQLDALAWPESTKTMQREWIGRSEGAEIEFGLGGEGVLDLGTPDLRAGGLPLGTPDLRAGRSADDLYRANIKLIKHPSFLARDPYPPGVHGPVADLISHNRFLPHHRLPGATYFVTWRAVPGTVLSADEMKITLDALLHFQHERHHTFAAVVMPDHVHWLVRPNEGEELGKLVTSVKQFSATRINKGRGTGGSLWVPEAFDHIVRDERYLAEFVNYIVSNPIKGGLVDHADAHGGLYVDPVVLEGVGGERPGPEVRGTQVEGERPGPEVRGTQRQGTQGEGLTVFTTRPDTLFGATYMVVAPEHELIGRVLAAPGPRTDVGKVSAYVQAARHKSDVDRQEAKTKTGVDLGIDAVNPATGGAIPVWVADYVLMGYGTGAIMAVPGHDERDFEFAKAMGLPVVEVVRPPAEFKGKPGVCFSGAGTAINSSGPEVSIDGLPTAEAKEKIIVWLEGSGRGVRKVNYRLRDWTFSRQRYWGEPIPIVFDEDGNHYPVSASGLPVELPELEDYAPAESDDAQPLLAKAKAWMHTTAGAAGVEGVDPALLNASSTVTREANTMPGSAGSSWYFLRYCDPKNTSAMIDPKIDAYWMGDGVDFYIGGSEHTVGHLLYARFWQNALRDLGHVTCREPFRRLFHQGMITSFAYQRGDKSLVPVDEVDEGPEGVFVERATGKVVEQIVAKMSKSLKNVINPDEIIAGYGADTFRLYEMYMGPLEASKPWNTKDIIGPFRFLQRLWRNVIDEQSGAVVLAGEGAPAELTRLVHRTIAGVTQDIENISLHTAIAKLIELNNAITKAAAVGPVPKSIIEPMLVLLAPFCPHICEELWSRLGHEKTIADASWPTHDPAMLVEETVEIPVQVQGKLRGKVLVPGGSDAKTIEQIALADAKVQGALEGKPIKRVIVVPGKLVNIVTG